MASTTRQIENQASLVYQYLFQAQDDLAISDEDMPTIIAHIHHEIQNQIQELVERPEKPHLFLIAHNPK